MKHIILHRAAPTLIKAGLIEPAQRTKELQLTETRSHPTTTTTPRLSHQHRDTEPPGITCCSKKGLAWGASSSKGSFNCWSQLFLGVLESTITFTTRVKDNSTESLTQKLLMLLSSGASKEISSKPNQKSKHKLKWPETYRARLLYHLTISCSEMKCSSNLILFLN